MLAQGRSSALCELDGFGALDSQQPLQLVPHQHLVFQAILQVDAPAHRLEADPTLSRCGEGCWYLFKRRDALEQG